MDANGSPSVDQYVIATYALWAGDVEYCQALLKGFAPLGDFGGMPVSVCRPEELVQYVAALRQRQISQKKGEFVRVADSRSPENQQLSLKPELVVTRHLRGVLWRLDTRRFQLLGYISDLSWEKGFFARVARRTATSRESESPPKSSMGERDQRALRGQGGTWFVPGDLSMQVVVGDLGHIEVDALWTKEELPRDGDAVTSPLIGVLRDLDEQ